MQPSWQMMSRLAACNGLERRLLHVSYHSKKNIWKNIGGGISGAATSRGQFRLERKLEASPLAEVLFKFAGKFMVAAPESPAARHVLQRVVAYSTIAAAWIILVSFLNYFVILADVPFRDKLTREAAFSFCAINGLVIVVGIAMAAALGLRKHPAAQSVPRCTFAIVAFYALGIYGTMTIQAWKAYTRPVFLLWAGVGLLVTAVWIAVAWKAATALGQWVMAAIEKV